MRQILNHGKLPDPFLKRDGTRVSPRQWPAYKEELRRQIADISYGGMPPRPEVVRIELLNDMTRCKAGHVLRIHAGTKEKQVSFLLRLWIPPIPGVYDGPVAEGETFPVVLTGDGCWPGNMSFDVIEQIRSRGFIAASFDRLELANDCWNDRRGGLYDLYPDMEFTAISAWAWGYQVCMDVFQQLSYVDETEVGITGHSRGGKTVLLAAAMDERIKYVWINNSGCHGAVSYRSRVIGQGDKGGVSESLETMLEEFPMWMGPKLAEYAGHVQDLPYDMHYFGALIAPRYYVQCEGMQDYWINPVGAWQNFQAVKACYEYLGCGDHCAAWFRSGGHRHAMPEFQEFLTFMERSRKGLALQEHLCIDPYPQIPKNFDW